MKNYQDYLLDILGNGDMKPDRTGVGTFSVFGRTLRWDLAKGFPAVTTKKLAFKAVVTELLWFLRGDTNIKFLHDHGVTIWDEWADAEGELGPVYGRQWRSWPNPEGEPIDQIAALMTSLRKNPDSRRHLVASWNPAETSKMALPPCHPLFQFYVTSDDRLSCQFYMRSIDSFLGLPFNIASYALLTHIIADQLDYEVGELIWVGGDCHIYLNHQDQVIEQLNREPRELPALRIKERRTSLFDYQPSDFELVGYDPHPAISAPIAV